MGNGRTPQECRKSRRSKMNLRHLLCGPISLPILCCSSFAGRGGVAVPPSPTMQRISPFETAAHQPAPALVHQPISGLQVCNPPSSSPTGNRSICKNCAFAGSNTCRPTKRVLNGAVGSAGRGQLYRNKEHGWLPDPVSTMLGACSRGYHQYLEPDISKPTNFFNFFWRCPADTS
jgi:hypothetical protein